VATARTSVAVCPPDRRSPPGLYLLVRDAEARAALREALHGDWAWSKVAQAPDHLPLYQLAAGDARDAAR